MNGLTIHPVPALKDNYVWTITDASQHALIVDPGDAAPVRAFLQQNKLRLMGILITHHHWDHTNGVLELKNEFDVPVFGPANEKIAGLTMPVHEHSEIKIDGFPLTLQIIAIPGHTLGHIAFYSLGMVFCGDTLFAAGCGRIFEGTAAQMFASLQKIAILPEETKIYCAHEYTLNNLHFAEIVEPGNNRIAERIKIVSELRQKNLPSLPAVLRDEKETNPFLRCHSQELIRNVEKYAGHVLNHSLEVFTWLRKWKDEF